MSAGKVWGLVLLVLQVGAIGYLIGTGNFGPALGVFMLGVLVSIAYFMGYTDAEERR